MNCCWSRHLPTTSEANTPLCLHMPIKHVDIYVTVFLPREPYSKVEQGCPHTLSLSSVLYQRTRCRLPYDQSTSTQRYCIIRLL